MIIHHIFTTIVYRNATFWEANWSTHEEVAVKRYQTDVWRTCHLITWGLSFGAKPLCYQTFSFLIPWNDKQVMADKICIIMANEHRIPDANFKVSQTAVCLFLTSKIIFILIYIPPGCRLLSCTSMRTVTENMQNYKMVLSRLTLSSQSTRKESIQSRRF